MTRSFKVHPGLRCAQSFIVEDIINTIERSQVNVQPLGVLARRSTWTHLQKTHWIGNAIWIRVWHQVRVFHISHELHNLCTCGQSFGARFLSYLEKRIVSDSVVPADNPCEPQNATFTRACTSTSRWFYRTRWFGCVVWIFIRYVYIECGETCLGVAYPLTKCNDSCGSRCFGCQSLIHSKYLKRIHFWSHEQSSLAKIVSFPSKNHLLCEAWTHVATYLTRAMLLRSGLISVVTVWTAGNLANCSAPPAQVHTTISWRLSKYFVWCVCMSLSNKRHHPTICFPFNHACSQRREAQFSANSADSNDS